MPQPLGVDDEPGLVGFISGAVQDDGFARARLRPQPLAPAVLVVGHHGARGVEHQVDINEPDQRAKIGYTVRTIYKGRRQSAAVAFLRSAGLKPVVVHGGGPQISSMLNRLGIASEFRGGLRVTTPEAMDVVRMVLTGQVGREPHTQLLGQRAPQVTTQDAPHHVERVDVDPRCGDVASLADVEKLCVETAAQFGLKADCRQSNREGELVDFIHEAHASKAVGIIINAGGYSHTSIALHDAIKGVNIPTVEVHVTNIHARESFRHHSFTAMASFASLAGFGIEITGTEPLE